VRCAGADVCQVDIARRGARGGANIVEVALRWLLEGLWRRGAGIPTSLDIFGGTEVVDITVRQSKAWADSDVR
jgi:hypothetical protein